MLYNTWKHFKSSSHHLKLFFPPFTHDPIPMVDWNQAFWLQPFEIWIWSVIECWNVWSEVEKIYGNQFYCTQSRHPSFQVTCWLHLLSNHSILLTLYFKTTYLQFHLKRESGVVLFLVVVVSLMIRSSM